MALYRRGTLFGNSDFLFIPVETYSYDCLQSADYVPCTEKRPIEGLTEAYPERPSKQDGEEA
jgi:hypothetical protein